MSGEARQCTSDRVVMSRYKVEGKSMTGNKGYDRRGRRRLMDRALSWLVGYPSAGIKIVVTPLSFAMLARSSCYVIPYAQM